MQMLRAVMGKYGHGQRNAGGHYVGRFSNQVCQGHCQYLYWHVVRSPNITYHMLN